MINVIPKPTQVEHFDSEPFVLQPHTVIAVPMGADGERRQVQIDAEQVATYLATELRSLTGYEMTAQSHLQQSSIYIYLTQGDEHLGEEGYTLRIGMDAVHIEANSGAGLFRGVQTFRQLLGFAPHGDRQWTVPSMSIRDHPRFGWRGLMLDVARHFFDVETVKRVIDIAALYKLNILHLHLTDDQGWRIAIDSWPKLTAVGGQTQVGGGRSGYFTKADYAEIVSYAVARYITVVPEIDVPGHTNAALVSYPELTCDDQRIEPFTGINVGFSSLCLDKPITDTFLSEVFGELAEMTPGPYLHIGGDEALTLTTESYAPFMERVQKIVQSTGKQPVGWQEFASSALLPGALVQYWNTGAGPAQAVEAVGKGAKVIMSPGNHTYLDMKYDEHTELGLTWAGHVDVRDAYEWEPDALASQIAPSAIEGVEAALWTETVTSREDIERMVLPRLPAIAEVAWSHRPVACECGFPGRGWQEFRERLAAHGPRWDAGGLTYHRSAQIPW